MYRPRQYEANEQQIHEIFTLPDERAQRISRNLAELFLPAHAYSQLSDEETIPDIGRIAYELQLRLVDNPEHSAEHQLAPFILDGARVIRGIALWTRRQDIARPPAALSSYKTELVQT